MSKKTSTQKRTPGSMSDVICEISRISNRGRVKRVVGYAVRWETSGGADMQMQWGQLKSKLRQRMQLLE